MIPVVMHEMGEIFFAALEVSAEWGDVCHDVRCGADDAICYARCCYDVARVLTRCGLNYA
jgi:hypothetical protein